jgi:hypothetical protein
MTAAIGFSALFIAILGLLLWFMNVSKPKPWAEVGRIIFACGFLAFCFGAAGQFASCNAGTGGAAAHIGR